jgi:hypothetical protein
VSWQGEQHVGLICLQKFGEDIAILAGDALLSLSFEYIARETRGVDPARVLRVSASACMASPSSFCSQNLALYTWPWTPQMPSMTSDVALLTREHLHR